MSFQTKKTMQKKILLTTLLFTIALSGCKEKAKDHNHSAAHEAKDHNHSEANEEKDNKMTAAMDVEPSDQVMDMKQMTAAMDVAETMPINTDMMGPHNNVMPRISQTPTAAMDQIENNGNGMIM